MKKLIALVVALGFLVGVAGIYASDAAPAKKKFVKKKAVKKTVKKPVRKAAPAPAPAPVAPAPPTFAPPPPAMAPKAAPAPMASLFGLGYKSDITGLYLYAGKGFLGTVGGRYNLVLDDLIGLGPMVGLSSKAVNWKVGLGAVYGKDNADKTTWGVPVFFDGVLNLPADVMGGMESYLGGGISYSLFGTGRNTGGGGAIAGAGIQAFYGIQGDLGLGLGKTALEIGYSIIKTGGSTAVASRSSKGITVSVSQPFVL